MATDAPTKVLYCETNVDGTVGGSYFSLLYLVKGLDRRRYEPLVLFYTEHRLLSAFHDAGIETMIWPKPPVLRLGAGPRTLLTPLTGLVRKAGNVVGGFLRPALARARFIRQRGIGIVHLNNSILYNHDWMLASRLAGSHCVSHERGINDVYPWMARVFGRRLDAVICISEAVRQNMIARGAGFSNLVTIHNGLNPSDMKRRTPPADLRLALGVPASAPVIVMVGNIKSWKGQETVVRAVARIRERMPQLRCVFVGDTAPGDAEYAKTLQALVTSLSLERNVIFAGVTPHVADYLDMSDLVVHASVLPEPFGRVVLEAMACRRPVVGSRGGAITEIVVDGETGLTFAPGDDGALADALGSLLNHPDRARACGERGYQRLLSEFHIDRNVEATQRLYDSIRHATH